MQAAVLCPVLDKENTFRLIYNNETGDSFPCQKSTLLQTPLFYKMTKKMKGAIF